MYADFKNAYTIDIGNMKMTVVTDIGPRIMSLETTKSGNIFWNNPDNSEASFRDWYIYGGHRFWLSPESLDCYVPDNTPCEVVEDEEEMQFISYSEKTEIERRLIISENEGRFVVEHAITNKGDLLAEGGIWALSCVKPNGTAFFPWKTPGRWQMNKIIYWQQWGENGEHTSQIGSKQFIQTPDLFLVKPNGEEGKVGSSAYEGFVGITNDKYTFIKSFDRLPTNDYPDDNCAVECYTCADFTELETLSPKYTLLPGMTYSHIEEWLLIDKGVNPENGDEVRVLL